MNQSDAANNLESEWDRPAGFFARLRAGEFDGNGATRVLDLLTNLDLDLDDAEPLERGLARQLWYIPLFCQWQVEQVEEQSGDVDGLKSFVTTVTNALEEKIGVP